MRHVCKSRVACLQFVFLCGRLAVPLVGHGLTGTPLFFSAPEAAGLANYGAEKEEKEAALRAGKEKEMTKTMKIEGMMCMHCEATVKKALEAVEGVKEAAVSHEKGTAVVTMEQEVADEVLKGAVEAKDYKVTGIA